MAGLVIAERGDVAEKGPVCGAEKAGTLIPGRQQRERVRAEASSRLVSGGLVRQRLGAPSCCLSWRQAG